MEEIMDAQPLRAVIGWTVALCLGVAMAPWFSGGQDPLGTLLSGFALLLGALLLYRQPGVRRLQRGPLVWLYGALVGWAGLSLVWSANRYSTQVWLISLITAGLAFRLAYALAGEVAGKRRLLAVYLASAVAVAAYGIYVYTTGGYDRLTSSFYWPNPAAAYFIPALLVSLDIWRRTTTWWWGILTLLFGTSFVLTESRAAGLVLIVLLAVYLLCIRLNKRFWIIFVFSCVASFGLAYGFTDLRHFLQPKAVVTAPGSRLAPASATGVQSGSDRIHYLQSVFIIWSHHPLLGTGAGTYGDVHPQYQIRVVSASTSAHNVYIQTLAELGLLGMALLIWMVVTLSVGTMRGLLKDPRGMALAMGMAGLLIHFGLDIDTQYPALVILAAVLGGSLYYQKPVTAKLSWRMPVTAMLVLVPITLFYLSDTWRAQATDANANDDTSGAGELLAKAHSLGFYNPDVLSADGINHYTLSTIKGVSELKSALMLARHAEKSDPADGQHYQLEGRILQRQGDNAGAEVAFRRALVLDPYNHPDYSYDLAYLLIQEKRTDEAKKVASSMLAQYPPSVVANRSADPTVALNLSDLTVMLGSLKLQSGDIAGAKTYSRQALVLDPSNVRAQALASVLARLIASP